MAKANSFEAINKCLGEYYTTMGNDTYYDDENGVGKFLDYCTENGLEETDLKEEIEDNEPEDCMYLEFAHDDYGQNKFPFRVDIADEQQQLDEMHKILQHIYRTGEAPKFIKEILDFELEVTNKDTQNATQLYKSQVFSMLGGVGLKDGALMEFFTIGVRNNDLTFLNAVVDSYSRDFIAAANDGKGRKNLHVNDWVKDNNFLTKLHKKNEMKVSKFTSAVNSYVHRIVPRLQIKQIYKMRDDIRQISQYIMIGTHLIQNMVQEQKALPPFMIDVIIAVRESIEDNDDTDLPDLGNDSDDSDDDDDDDDDDEEKGQGVVDKIGDIHSRLSHEKCVFVKIEIDPSELKNAAPMTRKMVAKYLEFAEVAGGGDGGSYPRRRRFNILIDRRGDAKKDALFFFEPPSNCNTMPQDQHVPEWYFAASRECTVPGEGYNAGKGDGKYTLSSITKCHGALMTLSFHIEAADEIKCYLFYEGQSARFYPQDILEVFPKLFDMGYKNNAKFIESEAAKVVAQNILIKDVHFETFYRSFGNDKDFPKYDTSIEAK